MKNNKSANDIEQIKRQDYVTNKLLLVFTIAFGFILFFMNVGRMMKDISTFMVGRGLVRTMTWVSVGILVAGIILAIVEHSIKRDTKYKLITGANIAGVALLFAICNALIGYYSYSVNMLMMIYIFIPSVVVLYIIFHSYQREFFFLALSSVLGGVGIWVIGSGMVSSANKIVVAVSAAVAIIAAITIWAQIGGGKVKLFGREIEVFKNDARYAILYLTYILVIALLATAVIAADIALYFVFGLIGYVVLAGIYYTVKLI